MSEMNVSVKFSCKDKGLQKELRDIFDVTCINDRKDYLGLGELEGNSKWTEFYARLEQISEFDQEYSFVDSYITTLETMYCEEDYIKLNYAAGAFGSEFAEEMKALLKNLNVDNVEIKAS